MKYTIANEDAGVRLDVFLARIADVTRSRAGALIKEGTGKRKPRQAMRFETAMKLSLIFRSLRPRMLRRRIFRFGLYMKTVILRLSINLPGWSCIRRQAIRTGRWSMRCLCI